MLSHVANACVKRTLGSTRGATSSTLRSPARSPPMRCRWSRALSVLARSAFCPCRMTQNPKFDSRPQHFSNRTRLIEQRHPSSSRFQLCCFLPLPSLTFPYLASDQPSRPSSARARRSETMSHTMSAGKVAPKTHGWVGRAPRPSACPRGGWVGDVRVMCRFPDRTPGRATWVEVEPNAGPGLLAG